MIEYVLTYILLDAYVCIMMFAVFSLKLTFGSLSRYALITAIVGSLLPFVLWYMVTKYALKHLLRCSPAFATALSLICTYGFYQWIADLYGRMAEQDLAWPYFTLFVCYCVPVCLVISSFMMYRLRRRENETPPRD